MKYVACKRELGLCMEPPNSRSHKYSDVSQILDLLYQYGGGLLPEVGRFTSRIGQTKLPSLGAAAAVFIRLKIPCGIYSGRSPKARPCSLPSVPLSCTSSFGFSSRSCSIQLLAPIHIRDVAIIRQYHGKICPMRDCGAAHVVCHSSRAAGCA